MFLLLFHSTNDWLFSDVILLIARLAELLNVVTKNGAVVTDCTFVVIGLSTLMNSTNKALRKQRLRSVAFAWSAFVDGLGQQQCQFIDIYIVIFTPSIFGRDITGF